MESSRNENTPEYPQDLPEGPQEQVEHGIEIIQGNQQPGDLPEGPQEEIEDELSPCSTLIMEPGTSSPTLPDTPSTSDEDIQEASRSPSPSLLQDYEDYDIDEDVINIHDVVDIGVIKDLNAMVDEDVNIHDVVGVINDMNAMVDEVEEVIEDYEVEVIADMDAMLQAYNHGEILPGPLDESMPPSSPVSSRTRSAARRRLEANQPVSSRTRSSYKRSLDADQTESTPVPSRIKRTRLEKDPSPK